MAIERIVLYQVLQNQTIQNSFLLGREDVTNSTEMAGAIQSLIDAYEDHLASVFVTGWRMDRVTRQNVSGDGFPALDVSFTQFTGAGAGDAMANTVAGIVHFRAPTAAPNKSTKFLSGWVSSATTPGGIWESGALNAMTAWADAILDIPVNYPDIPVVVGRFYPGTSEISVANQVYTRKVSLVPGTRKSRRIGVGS